MNLTTLKMELSERSYDIRIGQGSLRSASSFFDLRRKVLVVTDSGVPSQYARIIADQCAEARIFTFPEGEESKNLSTFENILGAMLDFGMQRGDAAIAVGGGVVGDITGFAASAYMRGIDFYNVPTTLLSQLDSSIGGKTAVDFRGVKNIIGAFYQPKGVLIDTDVLATLDSRQLAAGLAEAVKMAATSDKELFEMIESGLAERDITTLITRALKIKKAVVEEDERESGIRRILNFGHTFGHGIESLGGRLHGECVALGMIPMASGSARARILAVLERMNLPTGFDFDIDKALELMKHDKKGDGDATLAVFLDDIGSCKVERISHSDLCAHIKKNI